ncbi:hypothetical protein [Rufibacter roseus]|uniref:Uncharacterized protein n=1 Tax=Rufibacter roseus TaxID=1567108 RepID=A0ABW2DMQ3_9BACT|nr:hypothetical protein [Rufibacter roseus]
MFLELPYPEDSPIRQTIAQKEIHGVVRSEHDLTLTIVYDGANGYRMEHVYQAKSIKELDELYVEIRKDLGLEIQNPQPEHQPLSQRMRIARKK